MARPFGMSLWVVVITTLAGGCDANEVADTGGRWGWDCVGRLKLSLPGEFEIAANAPKMLEREFTMGSIQPSFDFADGEHAGWSTLAYIGRLYASPPLTEEERGRLLSAAERYVERVGASAKTSTKASVFEKLSVQPHAGSAARLDRGYGATIFVGETMLRISASSSEKPWEMQRQHFELFISGAKPRKAGEVPPPPGVCVPYAFIHDSGSQWREIAMTYRLKAHPDLTIMLKDATAAAYDADANPSAFEPEAKSDSFWSRYDNTCRRSLRSVWRQPYKSINLAGTKGVQSFVEIVRKDGSTDYGYLAVARGDPKAKQDRPDLMLYVLQNSRHAKAKGVAPLGKDAFIELAQGVAASIRHR